MTHGIYRAQVPIAEKKVLIKYQVGASAADAEERAVRFDDPAWRGAEFKLIEATLEPFSEGHQQNHCIIVSQFASAFPKRVRRR